MRGVRLFLSLVMVVVVAGARRGAAADVPYRGHGVAMHGDLKYGPDFTHFDYVNPHAPKGGEVTLCDLGTFDSFNPFIIKGNPAAGIGRSDDTLLTAAADEPFSEYGLLAETRRDAGGSLVGDLHAAAKARWHDGSPVTRRRRDLDLRDAARQGPAVLTAPTTPSVDRVEKIGERTRPASTSSRHRQSRAAADRRPAAGAAEALLGEARFRAHDARAAARQRPLQDRELRGRPLRRSTSASPTTGARTCR